MLRSAWIFGVGGLFTLWYAWKVLLLSISRKPEALCRSCDSAARRWSRAVLKLAGVSVQIEGVENLPVDGAFIIIANHESWFDVWALAGFLPIDARFAAKKELERIPVFGRAWRACGHISIDRSDHASAIESMTQAGLQIKEQGLNMVFFAEGTRCPDGTLQPFKKGPFVIAIEEVPPWFRSGWWGPGRSCPRDPSGCAGETSTFVLVSPFQWRAWSMLIETASVIPSGTPSPDCGAVKDGPPAYRENRHWTMFRSHRNRIHHELGEASKACRRS